MWLFEVLYSPISWVPFLIFLSVLAYFYWCERKEKEEKQKEREMQLLDRIKKLEENQK